MFSTNFCGLIPPMVSSWRVLPSLSCLYVQKKFVHHHKEAHDLLRFIGIKRSNRARANRNTHINERYLQKPRGRKMVLVELPEDDEKQKLADMTPVELRTYMLRKGINPYKHMQPRVWSEHQITFHSAESVLDPSVTSETFLQGSISDNVSEVKQRFLNRWRSYRHGTQRIRKKEGFEKFDAKTFGLTADTIYVEAHKSLLSRDKKLIHKYLTENAFKKMWPEVENGTVIWDLIEHVQPSKVVSVRCSDFPLKSGNDIAQITVRMHTVQKLAIYDRFGHLILGSEIDTRPVIEYVVFENHIASLDGIWRLHDKIYPKWGPSKQPIISTGILDNHRSLSNLEKKVGNKLAVKDQAL